ncbi:MAG: NAD-dependent epimerase/dehydratase family protein [Candidatus Thermoplasmatota archaeon]|nr:NAD-dependent epimerase/dehydratase family protein [Candidatus Thermoplasmatota archaeon]
MKVLVTGSSGYVGMVLSRHLSERGTEVVGLDVTENNSWSGNANFRFIECDVTDRKKVKEIFERERPTHVIHLAYLMNPLHDVRREYEIDVVGSRNVFEAAMGTESVGQFIGMSSTSAYGGWPDNKLWIKEGAPLRPRGYRYGINKKEIEEYMNGSRDRAGFKLVILRMCTAVGPSYHKKGGVVSLLAKTPVLTKFNNRYTEVQFIHEEDLTAVFDLILKDPDIEGTFNLAPDSYETTRELSKAKVSIPVPLFLMKGITSVLWTLHLASMRAPAIELSTYGIVADPKKLMKRLNFRFRYGTKEAYFHTVEERRNRGTL